MLGPIPPEIGRQIRPMPEDFHAAFTSRPGLMTWRGNVIIESPGSRETIACELGARFTQEDDVALIADVLRRGVWHIKEIARIGYVEGLKAARADRHAGRPVLTPQIAPTAGG